MFDKLIEAIKNNRIDEAKSIIEVIDPTELSQFDKWGMTALHSAAVLGNTEVCDLLTKKMEPKFINAPSKDGKTALHYGALKNHEKVCELLVQKMTQKAIEIRDDEGNTALHWAAEFFNYETCRQFTDKMSVEAINAIAKDGTSALYNAASRHACSSGGKKEIKKEICKLLLLSADEQAVNSAPNGYDSNKVLHWIVCEKPDIELMRLCLEKMSPETIAAVRKGDNFTPLHLAASGGSVEACKLLIEKMDSKGINAVSNEGKTALSIAADKDHREIYELFINLMHKKKIIDSLNDDAKGIAIISKIIADFIIGKFSSSEDTVNLSDNEVKLLKLYPLINKKVLCYELDQLGKGESSHITNINSYIINNYFVLTGVCKVINKNSPILVLTQSKDCMLHILSYLDAFPSEPLLLGESFEDDGEYYFESD